MKEESSQDFKKEDLELPIEKIEPQVHENYEKKIPNFAAKRCGAYRKNLKLFNETITEKPNVSEQISDIVRGILKAFDV